MLVQQTAWCIVSFVPGSRVQSIPQKVKEFAERFAAHPAFPLKCAIIQQFLEQHIMRSLRLRFFWPARREGIRRRWFLFVRM
jgi:hypothetical protein